MPRTSAAFSATVRSVIGEEIESGRFGESALREAFIFDKAKQSVKLGCHVEHGAVVAHPFVGAQENLCRLRCLRGVVGTIDTDDGSAGLTDQLGLSVTGKQ